MSKTTLGKQFEDRFAKNWRSCFPNTFLFRLKDQMSGYKVTSQNPCDYLAYVNKQLWMLECKETKENTFNFAKLTQYEDMLSYSGLEGVNPYVIIWFSSHDKVIAVRIEEIKRLKDLGFKSINIKMLQDTLYNIVVIPSVKKRTFMDSDYTVIPSIMEAK